MAEACWERQEQGQDVRRKLCCKRCLPEREARSEISIPQEEKKSIILNLFSSESFFFIFFEIQRALVQWVFRSTQLAVILILGIDGARAWRVL